VLPKNFPDRSFDAISLHSAGQCPFARDYSKPGVFPAIAHERHPEMSVGNIFCAYDMIEPIFAQ
jgi:hypothetical protein